MGDFSFCKDKTLPCAVVRDSRIANTAIAAVFKPVVWVGAVRAGVIIPIEAYNFVFVRW